MKRLLALMICLVMLTATAAAEGGKRQPRDLTGRTGTNAAAQQEEPAAKPTSEPAAEATAEPANEAAADAPGERLIVDQIAVTIGEETFEPDLLLNLDAGYSEAGEFGSFFIEKAGVRLLPMSMQWDAQGMSIRLGNSSVYCFTPEMLGVEEMLDMEAIPEAEGGAIAMPVEIAYGFVDYLDGFEGDTFEIEPLELLAWLEGALYLEPGALRQWAGDYELPLITAERETLGYTIAVGGEEPVYFTLRDSEQQVSLQCADDGLSLTAIVGADTSLHLSLNIATAWEGYANETTLVTAKYQPKEDGSSTYSLVYEYYIGYEEEIYAALSEKQRLTVIGSSDAGGVHDAKVTYSEDFAGIDDLSASMHVSIEPAQVENEIAGETPIMIESDTDSSMNSMVFAAMGLLSDLERLMNDEAIGGIIAAYDVQSEQYYDVYMRGFDEDFAGYTTLEPPEFGWMPEGAELADLDVSESYVQYEYTLEGGTLYISIEAPNDIELESMEADEAAGESPLTYRSEGSFFTASVVESGVETKIYSYDILLTEAEVQQILDGRIWIGEGYDDASSTQM